ncbi:mitochondrial CDP-diacylglycerol--glycerol-3-phosphate 3-phosphatidyltransferase [Basidiobolus meristosporus CBS 931.73]|uniref:CDP-diacylglycerol--glycerol-3-phosphate 3-phosphatidyltransferase n=1 Tax=Basidiobolus meristosporus CBS 931.73 TaxID=1314790 RepID=A0A1Y1ZA23_9FUNG|nr:mitochondrial CDP-diacylglycerol--glycerol-3-phosphate 3-phosphatidyltransferase [Basidiobolus meristosporus CBS 931.73]|eukprot:ORY07101.1 mitochondrial CDP-diacylglycerol--glycerol-3-phosphate 3-phosphatidyltransferase [Basidiobolus meristosporus CBS 931.73]
MLRTLKTPSILCWSIGSNRFYSSFQKFSPLAAQTPAIPINAENTEILKTPTTFYNELKNGILRAKHRVELGALYIGTGESELIHTLHQALVKNKDLKVRLVLDGLRGTRESATGASSATMLLPLVKEFPGRVEVGLYHTPKLNGLLKKILPARFNEGIGVMHLKAYIFDDEVILSGANLSRDYFTNRQDRYIHFKSAAELSEYYSQLLEVVQNYSYQLVPTTAGYDTLISKSPDPVHEKNPNSINHDTIVFPVVQMGLFNIHQDERTMMKLLKILGAEEESRIELTSGYFNFTREYIDEVLKSNGKFRLLAASPEANGFFNSKGISKYIPPAYTYFTHQFFKKALATGKQDFIEIEEYKRNGWTYHAKGLWCYLNNGTHPSVFTIGSPNFGYRSVQRDLESQVIGVTNNSKLQQELHQEIEDLRSYSYKLDMSTFELPERRVHPVTKIAASTIRTML